MGFYSIKVRPEAFTTDPPMSFAVEVSFDVFHRAMGNMICHYKIWLKEER